MIDSVYLFIIVIDDFTVFLKKHPSTTACVAFIYSVYMNIYIVSQPSV